MPGIHLTSFLKATGFFFQQYKNYEIPHRKLWLPLKNEKVKTKQTGIWNFFKIASTNIEHCVVHTVQVFKYSGTYVVF